MTPAFNNLIKYFTSRKLNEEGKSFKTYLFKNMPTLKVYDFSNVSIAIDAIDDHYDEIKSYKIVEPHHNYLMIFGELNDHLYFFKNGLKIYTLCNLKDEDVFTILDGVFDFNDRFLKIFSNDHDTRMIAESTLRYMICGLYLINRPSGLSCSRTSHHRGNVKKMNNLGVNLDDMISTVFEIPRRSTKTKTIQYGNKRQVAYHFCRSYYKPSIGKEVEWHYKGNPHIAVKRKRKRFIK